MKLFLRELSLQMITEYLTWRDTPAAEANPSPSGRTSKAKQTQANPRDKNDPIFNHRVPPSSTRTHIYPPPPHCAICCRWASIKGRTLVL